MPHFTIEYSANLDSRLDMGKIVEAVRKAAVETGIFPLGGIRVRAIRCEHYAIADGSPYFGFLDMVLRLGEGRDLATRKKAGEHIFRALSDQLDPAFAAGQFALSFGMQINDKSVVIALGYATKDADYQVRLNALNSLQQMRTGAKLAEPYIVALLTRAKLPDLVQHR